MRESPRRSSTSSLARRAACFFGSFVRASTASVARVSARFRASARDTDPSCRSSASACAASSASRRTIDRCAACTSLPSRSSVPACVRSACCSVVTSAACCSRLCCWCSSSACCCSSAACCCSSAACCCSSAFFWRRPRALLLLELLLQGLGLLQLALVLRARSGRRVEVDGDDERAVVADAEAGGHQVVGLSLGGRLRRRAHVDLAVLQRAERDQERHEQDEGREHGQPRTAAHEPRPGGPHPAAARASGRGAGSRAGAGRRCAGRRARAARGGA